MKLINGRRCVQSKDASHFLFTLITDERAVWTGADWVRRVETAVSKVAELSLVGAKLSDDSVQFIMDFVVACRADIISNWDEMKTAPELIVRGTFLQSIMILMQSVKGQGSVHQDFKYLEFENMVLATIRESTRTAATTTAVGQSRALPATSLLTMPW